jgi:hypothetical protein
VLAAGTPEGTRYRLLETLRQFGEEQLVQSGDAASVQARHVRHFAELMARAWSGLFGPDDASWIRTLGLEYENLRVAVPRRDRRPGPPFWLPRRPVKRRYGVRNSHRPASFETCFRPWNLMEPFLRPDSIACRIVACVMSVTV